MLKFCFIAVGINNIIYNYYTCIAQPFKGYLWVKVMSDKETTEHLKVALHLHRYTSYLTRQYAQVKRYQQMEVFCSWSFGSSFGYFSELLHKLFPRSGSGSPDHSVAQWWRSGTVSVKHISIQIDSIKTDDIRPIKCLRKSIWKNSSFSLGKLEFMVNSTSNRSLANKEKFHCKRKIQHEEQVQHSLLPSEPGISHSNIIHENISKVCGSWHCSQGKPSLVRFLMKESAFYHFHHCTLFFTYLTH